MKFPLSRTHFTPIFPAMKPIFPVLATLVLSLPAFAQSPAPSGPYTLPPLPYSYEALEPHIDTETMRIHHDKHHQAYVDNANRLLESHPELARYSPEELIQHLDQAPEDIRQGLVNNVGGHINHSLFWQMMAPNAGGPPTGPIADAIDKSFGSFANFQEAFQAAASKRFGSGWAWLVFNPDGTLAITSTSNQDPPILNNQFPLLGLDVWEHAYYLKFQNRRPDYIKTWWNVVNWPFVNQQLEAAQANAKKQT